MGRESVAACADHLEKLESFTGEAVKSFYAAKDCGGKWMQMGSLFQRKKHPCVLEVIVDNHLVTI